MDGHVQIYDQARSILRNANPYDSLLCVERRWDERAEKGFMKAIEDEFQAIASKSRLLASLLNRDDSEAVTRYYALLLSRAEISRLDNAPIEVKGVLGRGRELSVDEEERLEKAGIGFMSNDCTWPARQIHGIQIQRKIDEYVTVQMRQIKRWGCCYASDNKHFILPSYTTSCIIPIAPDRAFVANVQRSLSGSEIESFNTDAFAQSERFVVAQDFRKTGLPLDLDISPSSSRKTLL